MQRVTKYPLLLARLYKVTPYQHEDRPCIKRAKEKIESALEQMNKVCKIMFTIHNKSGYYINKAHYLLFTGRSYI